jgi:hypothetical protein
MFFNHARDAEHDLSAIKRSNWTSPINGGIHGKIPENRLSPLKEILADGLAAWKPPLGHPPVTSVKQIHPIISNKTLMVHKPP